MLYRIALIVLVLYGASHVILSAVGYLFEDSAFVGSLMWLYLLGGLGPFILLTILAGSYILYVNMLDGRIEKRSMSYRIALTLLIITPIVPIGMLLLPNNIAASLNWIFVIPFAASFYMLYVEFRIK